MVRKKSYKIEFCVVCKKEAKEHRKIESQRIKTVNLSELLQKYGGLNVDSGTMCRYCYDKLLVLDRKCREFYETCQRNYQIDERIQRKRPASPPASNPSKVKTRICTQSESGDENIHEINYTSGRVKSWSTCICSVIEPSALSQENTSPVPSDHSYIKVESDSEPTLSTN